MQLVLQSKGQSCPEACRPQGEGTLGEEVGPMRQYTASAWILNLPAPALRKVFELHESSDFQCLLWQTEWTKTAGPSLAAQELQC